MGNKITTMGHKEQKKNCSDLTDIAAERKQKEIYTVGERQLKTFDSGESNLPLLLTFTHIPFLQFSPL